MQSPKSIFIFIVTFMMLCGLSSVIQAHIPSIKQAAPDKLAAHASDTNVTESEGKGFHEFQASDTIHSRKVAAITPSMSMEEREEGVSEGPLPYVLHIGDRMMVSIYGEANTTRDVMVDSAGQITYPIVGTLKAVGKTFNQLRQEMNERIRKVYRYTFVTLTPIEFGGEYYTVLGSVNIPGKKVLMGGETLLSALCRSGGFPSNAYRNRTIDLADLDHAFLLRRGEYVPVNFEKLVVKGDIASDVLLEPNDYIYIPNALEKEIYVLGEVEIPSVLGYINKVTLAESIAQAGGVTLNASSRAVVIRGSLNEPYAFYIDINLIFKGCQPDFMLKPGDIVYVPPRKFTALREIVQYAIRVFVSTAASDAGSNSWASITGSEPINNVNVIPNTVQSGVIPITPIIVP